MGGADADLMGGGDGRPEQMMATGTMESAAPGDWKTAWRAAQDGTATGCEATVVDPVILVGLIFYLTKLKW